MICYHHPNGAPPLVTAPPLLLAARGLSTLYRSYTDPNSPMYSLKSTCSFVSSPVCPGVRRGGLVSKGEGESGLGSDRFGAWH